MSVIRNFGPIELNDRKLGRLLAARPSASNIHELAQLLEAANDADSFAARFFATVARQVHEEAEASEAGLQNGIPLTDSDVIGLTAKARDRLASAYLKGLAKAYKVETDHGVLDLLDEPKIVEESDERAVVRLRRKIQSEVTSRAANASEPARTAGAEILASAALARSIPRVREAARVVVEDQPQHLEEPMEAVVEMELAEGAGTAAPFPAEVWPAEQPGAVRRPIDDSADRDIPVQRSPIRDRADDPLATALAHMSERLEEMTTRVLEVTAQGAHQAAAVDSLAEAVRSASERVQSIAEEARIAAEHARQAAHRARAAVWTLVIALALGTIAATAVFVDARPLGAAWSTIATRVEDAAVELRAKLAPTIPTTGSTGTPDTPVDPAPAPAQ